MAETQSTRRLHGLLWLLLGWSGLIFGRLVWLQVIHHDELSRLAQMQQSRTEQVPAMRGSIFDRNGQTLAKSLPAESVCVNPQKISDPGMAADLLSRVLKMNREKLFDKIQEASARGSGFLWIKRKILSDEAARLRSLNLAWVEFRPEMRRFYPYRRLAAHVIGAMGIVNPDDTFERGAAGIEASFDEDLAGEPGTARVFTDVKQNPYDSVVSRKPEPGSNITLTIDSNLQFDAEKALEKAVFANRAASGSLVAMNPYTGEILAMANYPTYDPNAPPTPDEPENARNNIAVTTPFEPGSVFKIVTVAAALESTRLKPETMINCGGGKITLFGRVIHDEHPHGPMSMADVLAHSSNIGAIQIALQTGDRSLYKYQRRFGFGRKTGIELRGESTGLLRRVEDWAPSSIGSLAMGHEVSVTSIQLALAGAAIANGGLMVKPRLVTARQKPGEAVEHITPEKPERIIRPDTAIQMRQMMEGVVLRGTARRYANLKGYTSGGKTGSAQIYDLKAHVYTHRYNASFLGFAPVANPQIVMVVTLQGTSGGEAGFGGPVAAPVFSDVAMTALRMLDVPKDLPDTPGLRASASVPDRDDHYDLAIAGLGEPPANLDARDSGAVRSNKLDAHKADAVRSTNSNARDNVRAGVVSSVTQPPVSAGASASAEASDAGRRPFFTATVVGPKVPDFHGMTLRGVLEESSAKGLQVETLGAPEVGVVRAQYPPAGSILPRGAQVRVQFAK
jgi:cell division protein FtsI (penicillin-binding protein 3)